MCATVAAGLCLAGCRTIHSDRSANRATSTPAVAEENSGVRPAPPLLDAEPVKATIHAPAPAVKETPWYISHGEVSEKATARKAGAGSAPAGSYIVQKGDIAGRIAKQHGVTLSALKAANPGKDLNKLKIGQALVIPAKSAAKSTKVAASKAEAGTYIVQKGDILGRIAKQHGVKVADLKAANGLTSDRINVGQKLVIPGKAAEAKKTETKAIETNKAASKTTATETALPPPPPPQPVALPTPPQPVELPPSVQATPLAPVADVPQVIDVPAVSITPAAPAADGETHTVVAGEDILSLAIRWGISPEEIKNYNNLGNTQIKEGDILKIPPRD